MKVVIRYFIYSVVIVALVVSCISIFKTHPEVQFAFLMPGVFIIMYSIIRDDIYRRNSINLLRSGIRER
jgi:c-di-AMP phosphodiesterase-like protein